MPEVIDVDEFNRTHGKRRPNKYGAVKAEFNGRVYDSKFERDYAVTLDELLRAGELKIVIPQVTIDLADVRTRVDFFIVTSAGVPQVHECKGAWTAKWRQVMKSWRKHGPCEMHIIQMDRRGRRSVSILERDQ